MCNAQEIDDLFAALAEADSSCRVSKDVHKFVVRLPQSPHPPQSSSVFRTRTEGEGVTKRERVANTRVADVELARRSSAPPTHEARDDRGANSQKRLKKRRAVVQTPLEGRAEPDTSQAK